MSKVIYKFELEESTTMQRDAKIMHIGEQGSHIYIWALVDPNDALETYQFKIFGTGQEIDEDDLFFLKTIVSKTGFVWHIFEAK